MTGPGQIDPRQPAEQPGNLDQMRELAAFGDDAQAPLLDETVYPDTTGTLNRTRYPGEAGLLDGTLRQSQPPDPFRDSVERRAEVDERRGLLDVDARQPSRYNAGTPDHAAAGLPERQQAARPIESQRQLDESVREGAVYRCSVEGCGCEITVTHACAMPAIQRFIDCCGHEMRQV